MPSTILGKPPALKDMPSHLDICITVDFQALCQIEQLFKTLRPKSSEALPFRRSTTLDGNYEIWSHISLSTHISEIQSYPPSKAA
jgi:hypothetical protein